MERGLWGLHIWVTNVHCPANCCHPWPGKTSHLLTLSSFSPQQFLATKTGVSMGPV